LTGDALPMTNTRPILVVDDNLASRYATTRQLRSAGFQTLEAATGREALAMAGDHVSLVVLDIQLPDIDGFECCRLLREQPSTAHLPVVHLSAAYTAVHDRVRGLQGGADAYLTRPVEPTVLVATVQTLLRARAAEQALHDAQVDLLRREQAARAEAERVSRFRDELLAVLSHELRTPLNAILSWTSVMQRALRRDAAGGLPAELPRGVAAIERNGRLQAQLIADILDLSRLTMGKLRLDLRACDANELVRSALEALGALGEERGIRLTWQPAAGGPAVMADAARFQQVVWNLVTNAVKFSSPGGEVRLRVQPSEGGGEVCLHVEDDGEGIAPEFLPRLFDRFEQGNAATNRQHGGLGLGLSIVHHLVELHGGRVQAHSAGLGHGARFTVCLPSVPAGHAVAPAPTLESAFGSLDPDAAPQRLQGVRVLVVDDDRDAASLLALVLRDRGAEAHTVEGVDAALAAMTTLQPDVVISDIGMPGRDGYELARALGAMNGPRPATIALTSYARARDVEQALQAGFDAHCAKPVDTTQVLRTVAELWDRRSGR
jgi:signal transduction histidine kinase